MSLQQLSRSSLQTHEDAKDRLVSQDAHGDGRNRIEDPKRLDYSSMATTGHFQQRPINSPDIKSLPLDLPYAQISAGTVIQPVDLPNVPTREPSIRLGSTASNQAMSVDGDRHDKSASIEDPNDRMAAEALCGLGKVDSARVIRPRTPSGYETPLKYYPMSIEHTRSTISNGEAEPLLSLLTSSHPWLGGTITNSMSAYSSTKSHTPRFIQNSAEFVERHIGSPVANTVGSVGRKTGVEGSLRRYLGSKKQNESDLIDPAILGEHGSNKRRRISTADDDDFFGQPVQRTMSGSLSVDTLPVYDENRSPAYEATDSSPLRSPRGRPNMNRSWSTQLMISTSGLGAALNEASLRSLRYVLEMLGKATSHVDRLMEALRKLLQDYDSSRQNSLEEGISEKTGAIRLEDSTSSSKSNALSQRIRQLNAEIWQTVKAVVNTVSKYTGGALPENASVIVRWQLMSVPRRWQNAVNKHSNAQPSEKGDGIGESETVTSAHRMLDFAVEGLDMMEQVNGVVKSTIDSADKWLSTMGRKQGTPTRADLTMTATHAGIVAAEMNGNDQVKERNSKQERPRQEDEMLVDTS